MEEIMAAKNDESIPKITGTSTKKEMLEAFNELKQKYKEKDQTQLKPEKQKEEKHKTEIIKTTDTLTPEGTVQKINNLKIDINKTLSQLSEKLEQEAQNYLKLKEGIELKTKELKEIYEIENSAFALAALLEAQKQKKEEFEFEMNSKKENFDAEMNQKKSNLEDEIKQKRLQWEKEKKTREEVAKERDELEKKAREREKEEFQYNFTREKQLMENTFNDRKEKMEKELAVEKETFQKKVAETGKNLEERETKVSEREKLVDDLQNQVDTFPARLQDSVDKAVKDVTERLTNDAQKNEALLKKEYDGEKNVLMTKIEALEKLVEDQARQIADLSSRLETSYTKVQDIAVKAIEGSSASQRFNNIEKHIMEQKLSQPQQSAS